MSPSTAVRRVASAVLVLALWGPRPVFAQAGGMPILVAPPSVGALAGLMLIQVLIPYALFTPPDADRVRTLDRLEDWEGLAALASRRLASHPGDPIWHEVRGRALQRQGRCTAAVHDLQLAFDSRAAQPAAQLDTAFDTGIVLGLCQMAVPDLLEAARTMERLAAMYPERAEPLYHLGVIRAHQGNMDAALALLPALRAQSQAKADALQSYLAAATRASTQRTLMTEPPAHPGLLGDGRLLVGPMALNLPLGAWFHAAATQHTVPGRQLRFVASAPTDVRVVTERAYALDKDGSVAAAVTFSTNPQQAFGTSHWNVDDPCAGPATVYRYRISKRPDQPECVDVRIVDPASAVGAPDVQGAVRAAIEAGAGWKDPAYALHYAGYGLDRVVEATVLVPMHRFAGDMAAAQWLHDLAVELKPLARHPATVSATVPPLPGAR